jgi:hypothetical protein
VGRTLRLAVVAIALLIPVPGVRAVETVPAEPRERVAHHVREAEQLVQHFESVMAKDCLRFSSATEWKSYFDGEVDQVVLMVAHVEQAWIEAKRTHDHDLRRTAKAPRKHLEQARGLLGKLEECARDNGTSFVPLLVWRKIEQEVPKRQAQIALPLPP